MEIRPYQFTGPGASARGTGPGCRLVTFCCQVKLKLLPLFSRPQSSGLFRPQQEAPESCDSERCHDSRPKKIKNKKKCKPEGRPQAATVGASGPAAVTGGCRKGNALDDLPVRPA